MTRIDYYPVRISPSKPVWEVDWWIRAKLGLSTIVPPIEYRWRNASGRRNAKRLGAKPQTEQKLVSPITLWRRERTEEALERAVAVEREGDGRRRREKPRDMIKRPTAIVPCYVYPGFSSWADYHRLKRLSDELGFGIQGLPQYWDPDRQVYDYYALKPEQIFFLQEVTEGDGLRAKTQVHKSVRYREGDAVKITGDAWAGHEGKFVAVDRSYAKVLIQILGQLRIVDVPLSAIEAA